MATKNQVPTDGRSLEQRKAQKRALESDRTFDEMTRCKAVVHRSIVGDALPAGYAKGSFRYACAFRGANVTQDELQMMRDSMRRPEAATNAEA